jgi:hypothetical protein
MAPVADLREAGQKRGRGGDEGEGEGGSEVGVEQAGGGGEGAGEGGGAERDEWGKGYIG